MGQQLLHALERAVRETENGKEKLRWNKSEAEFMIL